MEILLTVAKRYVKNVYYQIYLKIPKTEMLSKTNLLSQDRHLMVYGLKIRVRVCFLSHGLVYLFET